MSKMNPVDKPVVMLSKSHGPCLMVGWREHTRKRTQYSVRLFDADRSKFLGTRVEVFNDDLAAAPKDHEGCNAAKAKLRDLDK